MPSPGGNSCRLRSSGADKSGGHMFEGVSGEQDNLAGRSAPSEQQQDDSAKTPKKVLRMRPRAGRGMGFTRIITPGEDYSRPLSARRSRDKGSCGIIPLSVDGSTQALAEAGNVGDLKGSHAQAVREAVVSPALFTSTTSMLQKNGVTYKAADAADTVLGAQPEWTEHPSALDTNSFFETPPSQTVRVFGLTRSPKTSIMAGVPAAGRPSLHPTPVLPIGMATSLEAGKGLLILGQATSSPRPALYGPRLTPLGGVFDTKLGDMEFPAPGSTPGSAMVPGSSNANKSATSTTASPSLSFAVPGLGGTDRLVKPAAGPAAGTKHKQQQYCFVGQKQSRQQKRQEGRGSPDEENQDVELCHIVKQQKAVSFGIDVGNLADAFEGEEGMQPLGSWAEGHAAAAGGGGTCAAAAASTATAGGLDASGSKEAMSRDGFKLSVAHATGYECFLRNEVYQQQQHQQQQQQLSIIKQVSKDAVYAADVQTLKDQGLIELWDFGESDKTSKRSQPGHSKKVLNSYIAFGSRTIDTVTEQWKVSKLPERMHLERLHAIRADHKDFPALWRRRLEEENGLALVFVQKMFAVADLAIVAAREGFSQCDYAYTKALAKGHTSESWSMAGTADKAKQQREQAFRLSVAATIRAVLDDYHGLPGGMQLFQADTAVLTTDLETTTMRNDLATTTKQFKKVCGKQPVAAAAAGESSAVKDDN